MDPRDASRGRVKGCQALISEHFFYQREKTGCDRGMMQKKKDDILLIMGAFWSRDHRQN
jgi:hypothetical protein